MATEVPYLPLPLDRSDVRYAHGPDSTVQEGVPAGSITELEWNDSTVYPGTSRRIWVYLPAQYTPMEPASLMVFQDGEGFLDPEDDLRTAASAASAAAPVAPSPQPGCDPTRSAASSDVRLVLDDGGHDSSHGGVLLPDALRWVSRPPDAEPAYA
jgi:hypothetical protein